MPNTLNRYPSKPILLIDDEPQFLFSVGMTLSAAGISNIIECADSRDVQDILARTEVSLVLLDLTMPYISGHELLPIMAQEYPGIPVVMVTAVNELSTAVDCMKAGAFDYLLKPVDNERLVTTVRHALELGEIRDENRRLKEYVLSDKLQHPEVFLPIITRSQTMHSIFQYTEAVSVTSLPVLITGETGVGKELIANAVHRLSGRQGEFIPVNIAGVDENLVSDMLFGHEKGAFTGADQPRKGLIQQAAGGTLFLDEIGDLNPESQIKLLRLLQEGKYYSVGSDVSKVSTARIVVATQANLDGMKAEGRFRHDLYYRLQVHHIHLPSLRERKEDIPLLLEHFLEEAADQMNKKVPTPPKELEILLATYSFPGNIRELEAMIFDAVSMHKSGVLSMDSFRSKISSAKDQPAGVSLADAESHKGRSSEIHFPFELPSLKEMEQQFIDEALRRANGNQTIAADMLKLSRRALNNRLQRSK